MNRRDTVLALMALGTAPLAAPTVAAAQQSRKIARVGYLDLGSRQSSVDAGRYPAYLQGMRELGYFEGKQFVVEARFAEGRSEQLASLAGDLVRLPVNVIVTFGGPAGHAAQLATSSIPVVAIAVNDPVREDFALTLARPGGNITGLATGAEEFIPKHFEFLTTVSPRISRIAILLNPANSSHPALLLTVQVIAQSSGRHVLPVAVGGVEDIERGFAAIARERAGAVIVLPDAFIFQQRRQIAALAIRHRLPSIHQASGFVEAGGLMACGPDVNDLNRRAAIFVDKLLKGAKPGEMPFELPTRYQLVINRKTAAALGLAIPTEMLMRADEVIQ